MPFKVRSGRLVSIPYSLEINDVPLFAQRNVSPDEYVRILKAQFDQLYEEGAESGTVMCIPLHPYLIGQPHRIKALDEVLAYVTGHNDVWLATGREIARWYLDHAHDDVARWLETMKEAA
jgi:allantoinase